MHSIDRTSYPTRTNYPILLVSATITLSGLTYVSFYQYLGFVILNLRFFHLELSLCPTIFIEHSKIKIRVICVVFEKVINLNIKSTITKLNASVLLHERPLTLRGDRYMSCITTVFKKHPIKLFVLKQISQVAMKLLSKTYIP